MTMTALRWHRPDDRLPKAGRYVLAQLIRDNWIDREDMDGCRYDVVKLIILKRADQKGGNNQRPYFWDTFGPDSYFGQDVTRWTYFRGEVTP